MPQQSLYCNSFVKILHVLVNTLKNPTSNKQYFNISVRIISLSFFFLLSSIWLQDICIQNAFVLLQFIDSLLVIFNLREAEQKSTSVIKKKQLPSGTGKS